MKRKITFLSIALCLCTHLSAQQGSLDSLKAIYNQLPQQYFPTEILHNRSPLYSWSFDPNYKAAPYNYTGSIPAPLIEKGWWSMLVNDMKQSATDTTLIPNGNLFQRRDSIARQTYEVPIAATHLNFHRIVPGAVDSGYLYYDTTAQKVTLMPDTLWLDKPNNLYQYYPNPDSLAQLAFEAHETFAGTLTNSAIYKQGTTFSITFGLVQALLIENQTTKPTLTEVDFDNGEGFKPVLFDVPIKVNYSGAGAWESYERTLRLRFHYGSDKVVETRMPLTVVPNAAVADTVLFASILPNKCNLPTNGFVSNEAKISIRYGNAAKKLKKPVFFN